MSTAKATAEDVKRLAALARVDVPEADLARFATEFDSILAYVGKLDELTLPESGAEVPALRNVLRVDGGEYESGTWTKALVEQFPQKEGDSLSVKKILSHD
jgi:aspartyl-tRNA(Asn)/glutamyl-tRNA(Gln) amidotransferase subunit C